MDRSSEEGWIVRNPVISILRGGHLHASGSNLGAKRPSSASDNPQGHYPMVGSVTGQLMSPTAVLVRAVAYRLGILTMASSIRG
jgi:hypothetical protein